MNFHSARHPFSALLSIAALTALAVTANAQTPTLDSEQSAFLTLINNYRSQNGAGPLQVSVALENSSQWMSNDMATRNYFSHTDSLGRDPFTRMAAFNYSYAPAGENLAAGNADAQGAFNQWVTACDPDASGACSYAHRQNMLNPSYVVIGIGRAFNASSTYQRYWTTDFGGYAYELTLYLDCFRDTPSSSGFSPYVNCKDAGKTFPASDVQQHIARTWIINLAYGYETTGTPTIAVQHLSGNFPVPLFLARAL